MQLIDYFMKIAEIVKLRSSCERRQVGSVIVLDGKIVGTGYNASASKVKHCNEVGCTIENDHCIRAVHSEKNAILNSARDLTGAEIYTTSFPCLSCLESLRNAKVTSIVFIEGYEYSDKQKEVFNELQPLFKWHKYEDPTR